MRFARPAWDPKCPTKTKYLWPIARAAVDTRAVPRDLIPEQHVRESRGRVTLPPDPRRGRLGVQSAAEAREVGAERRLDLAVERARAREPVVPRPCLEPELQELRRPTGLERRKVVDGAAQSTERRARRRPAGTDEAAGPAKEHTGKDHRNRPAHPREERCADRALRSSPGQCASRFLRAAKEASMSPAGPARRHSNSKSASNPMRVLGCAFCTCMYRPSHLPPERFGETAGLGFAGFTVNAPREVG